MSVHAAVKDLPKKITAEEAEKYLRDIETKDSILNGIKRVRVFKGSDALEYLIGKKSLKATEVSEIMSVLLMQHYIVKVKEENEQCILDNPSYEFSLGDQYIWIVEGSWLYGILLGCLVILGMLALAMFPIWPYKLKVGSGYLFYLLFGLFIALFVVSIIRLIVFGTIKVFTGQSLWILPNLFEECGILESFVPLWAWDEESAEKEKEKKAK
ncbi:translocation protein SEC62 [Nematocida sp. AWRm77]|nr:translocation protein SEC62 [Nematocida sp. AWRm77]